ncbi:Outer membrane lipoprotein-sorting protein [Sphingobacterium lactis]|uniref:Outer membrane lipoprotein-sorting protein n=2 Tax=Sphingobacterium lactis TaxID=797291 RepID=A0A1H5XUA7_9SPHI|nr:Outer membrane lipoprotein-sorting protein [Sphingobacterium lactis]
MNMDKLKGLLVLCAVLLSTAVFSQTKMSAAEASTFKANVDKQAQKITSITADFEASKYVSVIKNPSKNSGIFKLKGKKLLWKYNAPQQNAMLFDQDKLYMRDDKGKKSTIDLNKNRRFRQLQHLMTETNTGNVLDEKNFSIAYLKHTNGKSALLTPKNKDMARFIKEVVLTFPNNEYTVSEIKIVEKSNDYTVFKLKNKKFNTSISDSEFKL